MSDPYLLVRCGLVLLAQQVILSPHCRSAIRDGGETRIPSPVPLNSHSGSTGAEKLHHTIHPRSRAGEKRSRWKM
ncbi:hypothetical protein CesoFtcFv8_011353 [Champsocephalus esox]|uniref:Uncharacterized protein n=2 Tax=Champsocephalus TaxID=52236 RepID=A0AAN8HQB9_CHAGU|nr:hypothetical protein CesoFtcFv8_011353 [Champsocephalus esox]KAK5923707.1 hypothetical protein CgunFtcFv8_000652 [Champsocephalus gunnari]